MTDETNETDDGFIPNFKLVKVFPDGIEERISSSGITIFWSPTHNKHIAVPRRGRTLALSMLRDSIKLPDPIKDSK